MTLAARGASMSKAAASAATRLPPPEVNDLVRVTVRPGHRDGEAAVVLADQVPSRVEDVTSDARTGAPGAMVIAAPRFAGDVQDLPAGTACLLEWVTERGVFRLPAQLQAEQVSPSGLRTWRLAVTGPVTREERRRFVRAPWQLPAVLVVRRDLQALPPNRRHEVERAGVPAALAGLPDACEVTASNVSEGGLLCVSAGPVLPARLPLIATFSIEDVSFEAPSSVVWSMLRAGTGKGTGTQPVVQSAISFDDPAQYGEVLRPMVFKAQLQARRLGLI
ncbi:MAG TPA: hypothetical protein VI248_09940 [Kineosporiaceae bacterium]